MNESTPVFPVGVSVRLTRELEVVGVPNRIISRMTLRAGAVGVVVERLSKTPGFYDIRFIDYDGIEYASIPADALEQVALGSEDCTPLRLRIEELEGAINRAYALIEHDRVRAERELEPYVTEHMNDSLDDEPPHGPSLHPDYLRQLDETFFPDEQGESAVDDDAYDAMFGSQEGE